MSPDRNDVQHRGPASPLERYLTYWFLLVMALGGGVGFFVSDMSVSAELPDARAQVDDE